MTRRFGPSFQRFLHNSAAQTFGQVVNVLQQIFLFPFFLHCWTKQEYGEWLIITSVPIMLWVLDSGLSGLAGNRMTVAAGSGDLARANLIFHNVLFIQGILSLVILVLAGSYCSTVNVCHTFNFQASSSAEAHLVTPHQASVTLFCMIIYMLFGYGLGLLRAAYRASMLEARGVALLNVRLLAEVIVVIGVLSCGGHAVSVATGMLSNMAFWFLAGFFDAKRRCPGITWSFGPLHPAQAQAMLVDGLPVFAGTAASAFFLQGYPLIVNGTLGAAAVVTLTAPRTVSRTLLQVVGIVNAAAGSELSRNFGNKDWDAYLRILKVLIATTVWASIGAAVGLTLFGPWVIAKWSIGKVIISHQLMFLFALSVACQCCWTACNGILFSTNMHHAVNYTQLAMTLAGLSVVTFAIHAWGFAGVPIVMAAVDGVLLAGALYICHRKLSFIPLASLARVFSPAFYLEKARGLLRHVTNKATAA
jgi:O-antigen/teichoic acid export membrane protein